MLARDMRLSDIQVKQYWDRGYLVVKELITEGSLSRYSSRFEEIVNAPDEVSSSVKVMKDVMVVKGEVQMERPVDEVNKLFSLEDDPVFFDYISDVKLVSVVQSLLGETVFSLASNVFNKPPGLDGRHPMHQDLRYFKMGPANEIVGVWTSMGVADRESGCLSVIPESHKGGLLEHSLPDWKFINHGFYGIQDHNRDHRVHLPMSPGDTLLFHPLLVHGSGRNRSGACRRAISAHYASDCCTSERGDWREYALTRKVS